MAVPYKPELFSIEDVEKYFEISKGNCFRIYAGTNPKVDDYSRGECCDGDKQIAAEKLSECLISLKQNTENTNPYTIQVFNLDKRGNQIDKNCIIFQLNKVERILPYHPAMIAGTNDSRIASLLEKSIENQNLLISKISAMEAAANNEDEDDEDVEDKSVIGQLLKRDDVQNLLINGLTAAVYGLVNRRTPSPTFGGGVAGVNTIDEESISLLQELFSKGVDNNVLKSLNQMSESKLKTLIAML